MSRNKKNIVISQRSSQLLSIVWFGQSVQYAGPCSSPRHLVLFSNTTVFFYNHAIMAVILSP